MPSLMYMAHVESHLDSTYSYMIILLISQDNYCWILLWKHLCHNPNGFLVGTEQWWNKEAYFLIRLIMNCNPAGLADICVIRNQKGSREGRNIEWMPIISVYQVFPLKSNRNCKTARQYIRNSKYGKARDVEFTRHFHASYILHFLP